VGRHARLVSVMLCMEELRRQAHWSVQTPDVLQVVNDL
jgi:hypothetical protein